MIKDFRLSLFGNFENLNYTRENIDELFKLYSEEKNMIPIQFEEINVTTGEKSKRVRLSNEDQKYGLQIGVERVDFEINNITDIREGIEKGENFLKKFIKKYNVLINRLAINALEEVEYEEKYQKLVNTVEFFKENSQIQIGNHKVEELKLSTKQTKVNIISNFYLAPNILEISFDINTIIPAMMNYTDDDLNLFIEESNNIIQKIKNDLKSL